MFWGAVVKPVIKGLLSKWVDGCGIIHILSLVWVWKVLTTVMLSPSSSFLLTFRVELSSQTKLQKSLNPHNGDKASTTPGLLPLTFVFSVSFTDAKPSRRLRLHTHNRR